MNLVQYLELQAEDFLNKPAIIEEGEEISYRNLWQMVNKLAKAFLDMGIKEGDRIAICLPNCKEYIYTFLATLKINAIAVPLKQIMTSYELKAILKDSSPSLLVADNIFLRRMLPFDPSVDTGKLIICSKRIMQRSKFRRAIKIDDLFKKHSELESAFSTDDNAVASINYTYRGYGYPLGAMLTHKNFKSGIQTYICTTGLSSPQKVLLASPVSHIYFLTGCVMVPFTIGSSVIITKRSNPQEIIELIDSLKVTVITSVPTFYLSLLEAFYKRKNKLQSVQHCFSGGSLLQVSLYQRAKEEIGWDIRQGYGLTECLPVTCNPSSANNPASIGKAGEGVKVKIVDEGGAEKKIEEPGEIIVSGNSIMCGYYKRPKESKEVLKNGWCHTGDCGYLDKEEYLYFTGLKKKIAKVGGNMVDLVESEKTIRCFPGVINVKIEVETDEIWGNILTAEVLVQDSKNFNLKKLRSFLRDRLVSYKIPRIKRILE